MTENELRTALLPLLKAAKSQGAAEVISAMNLFAPLVNRAPAASHFSDGARQNNGADPDAGRPVSSGMPTTDFSAADIPDIGNYFAADDDGSYPGGIHKLFNCGMKQFADHSGLVQKWVTFTRDGKTYRSRRWVKRDAGQTPRKTESDGERSKPPGETGTPAVRQTPRKTESDETAAKRVGESVARDLSLKGKAADVALTAAAKVYEVLLHAAHSKGADALARVLGAVLDTPDDLKKLGYNPTLSSGTASPQNLDAVRAATGVSGHVAARIAAEVLSRAFVWLKGRLKGAPAQMAGGGWLREAVESIASAFDAANDAVGLPPIDRRAVLKAVQGLAGRRGFADGFVRSGADATNHDALSAGLTALASPGHIETRLGGAGGDEVFRGRLADLLQDHGRDDEADLLRTHRHPVDVVAGRVVHLPDVPGDPHQDEPSEHENRRAHAILAKAGEVEPEYAAGTDYTRPQGPGALDLLKWRVRRLWRPLPRQRPFADGVPRVKLPDPERGELTPEQAQLAARATETGDPVAWGALADHLAESGFANTGATLSRLAEGHPDAGTSDTPAPAEPDRAYPLPGRFTYAVLRDGSDHVHHVQLRLPDGRAHQFWHRVRGGVQKQGRLFADGAPIPGEVRTQLKAGPGDATHSRDEFVRALAGGGGHAHLAAFADWLQENGEPGAALTREAFRVRTAPETVFDHTVPSFGPQVIDPAPRGEPWRSWVGATGGVTHARMTDEPFAVQAARFRQPGAPFPAYLLVQHQTPESDRGATPVFWNARVPVRSRDHLRRLTADLPDPMRNELHARLDPHLPQQGAAPEEFSDGAPEPPDLEPALCAKLDRIDALSDEAAEALSDALATNLPAGHGLDAVLTRVRSGGGREFADEEPPFANERPTGGASIRDDVTGSGTPRTVAKLATLSFRRNPALHPLPGMIRDAVMDAGHPLGEATMDAAREQGVHEADAGLLHAHAPEFAHALLTLPPTAAVPDRNPRGDRRYASVSDDLPGGRVVRMFTHDFPSAAGPGTGSGRVEVWPHLDHPLSKVSVRQVGFHGDSDHTFMMDRVVHPAEIPALADHLPENVRAKLLQWHAQNYPELAPPPAQTFTADHATVANMLGQLSSPEHVHTRAGTDHPSADHHFRGVLADALQDHGRDHEAGLLRERGLHVMVHPETGAVVPAKYTLRHITGAEGRVDDHLRRITGGGYLADHNWSDTPGSPLVVFHHGDPVVRTPMHISEFPQALADHLDGRSIDDVADWTPNPAGITDRQWQQLDRHLNALRAAPFEEPAPLPDPVKLNVGHVGGPFGRLNEIDEGSGGPTTGFEHLSDGAEPMVFADAASGHAAFQAAIAKRPTDATARGVYADWIEEHDPQSAAPEALAFLRSHQGGAWVAHGGDGKVHGGRKWTMPEIKAANLAANADDPGRSWFSRGNTRMFGTRLLPKHVYSGPGGVYFVHEGDNFDRTAKEYRIALFHPKTGGTGSWSTYHRPAGGDREFVSSEASVFGTADDAAEHARHLAAGTGPYTKNQYWNEGQHGAAEFADEPVDPAVAADLNKAARAAVDWTATRALRPGARTPPKDVQLAWRFRDVARRRRVLAALGSERELATGIGGHHGPDSEPYDVIYLHDPMGAPITDPKHVRDALKVRATAVERLKNPDLHPTQRQFLTDMLQRQVAHAFEVKTLLKTPRNSVYINPKALAKKRAWADRHQIPIHVVAADARRGKKFTGTKFYVASGLNPTTNLAGMRKSATVGDVLTGVREGSAVTQPQPEPFAESPTLSDHDALLRAASGDPDPTVQGAFADLLDDEGRPGGAAVRWGAELRRAGTAPRVRGDRRPEATVTAFDPDGRAGRHHAVVYRGAGRGYAAVIFHVPDDQNAVRMNFRYNLPMQTRQDVERIQQSYPLLSDELERFRVALPDANPPKPVGPDDIDHNAPTKPKA